MATKTNGYTEGRVRQNTSPSTQWIDCGMRALKTYDNAESRAGRKKDSWEATDSNTEHCPRKYLSMQRIDPV